LDEVNAVHVAAAGDRLQVLGGNSSGTSLQIRQVDLTERSLVAGGGSFVAEGHQSSAVGGGFLYVVHTQTLSSVVNLQGGTPQLVTPAPNVDIDMLAPTRASRAWALAREEGAIYEIIAVPPTYSTVLADAEGAEAIAISAFFDDEFALVAYRNRVDWWELENGVRTSEEPGGSFAVGAEARSLVVAGSGYAFLGGSDGSLRVLTDRPWVDQVQVTPARVSGTEPVEVSFRLAQAASWQVVLGGSWQSGGEVLASGRDDAGRVRVDVAGRTWNEGENDIFVRVVEGGASGHGYTTLLGDGPPGVVNLEQADVRVDDGYVRVSFMSLSDPDIEHYTLYVSTTPFEPDQWPKGGPPYEGDGDVEAPVVLRDVTPGETVDIGVSGLVNGVTCFLAVRATDDGGLEGPMSDVVQATPSPTTGAAGLAGERGGMDCQATAGGSGLVSVWPALFVLFRLGRRRHTAAHVAASIGVAVAGPAMVITPAVAQDEGGTPSGSDAEEESGSSSSETPRAGAAPTFRQELSPWRLRKPENKDLTPVFGQISVRYGSFDLIDANLIEVYRSSADIWQVELGPQLFRVLEIKAGAGFFREVGTSVDVEGQVGSKVAVVRALPLSLGGTFRLHLLDEQVLVPFVTAGIDWWVWDERLKSGSTRTSQIWGGKFGYHYAVGGQLLLDTFSPGRASLLESQTEINDSWLTFEYRRQVIDGSQGLSFTGNLFTIGLKLDL
jgi:hypothetical protein